MRPLGRTTWAQGFFHSKSIKASSRSRWLQGSPFALTLLLPSTLHQTIHDRGIRRTLKTMSGERYKNWTKQGLIKRIDHLQAELLKHTHVPSSSLQSTEQVDRDAPVSPPPDGAKKPKGKRKVDPSKYATRYIALKLAYLGKNYGGFEFQHEAPRPSIEEELWSALTKACLIFPEDENVVDFDCCEYSKCGRTDRGVSAFGQVIGLRVRSSRPLPKGKRLKQMEEGGAALQRSEEGLEVEGEEKFGEDGEQAVTEQKKPFDPICDELPYARILNRLLPNDIRILAWCPSPPSDFSARFSCRERQYRYFFTQPAFHPEPSQLEAERPSGGTRTKPGWLDLGAMQDAAKRYEGEHDFRNVCKIDPAKQISNFKRIIFEASIEEVKDVASALPYLNRPEFAPSGTAGIDHRQEGPSPKVYSFNVRGSAFLWHQIRHMVSVLFLVGQGLESPSVVTELLDVEKNPRKPSYSMADEVPLVLWDCLFPEEGDPERKDALRWVYVGEDSMETKYGQHGLAESVWELWRERRMDELLANRLLQKIGERDGGDREREREHQHQLAIGPSRKRGSGASSTRMFEGGNTGRMSGRYVPIMKKDLQQSVEEQNDKYAQKKGFTSSEDMRAQRGLRWASKDDDE